MTHYDTLQISRNASPEMIEMAWKTLMKSCHPDRHKGVTAQRKTRELNVAHDILSDPAKRQAYDAELDFKPKKTPKVQPINQEAFDPTSAYPPAYPMAYQPSLEELVMCAAQGATEALLEKMRKDNPALAQFIAASLRGRA